MSLVLVLCFLHEAQISGDETVALFLPADISYQDPVEHLQASFLCVIVGVYQFIAIEISFCVLTPKYVNE